MADIKMEAAIIFESFLPNALRRALQHAGDDGFVASMPQLLHARVNASYDNIIGDTLVGVEAKSSLLRQLRRPPQDNTSKNRPVTCTCAICDV